MKIDSSSDSSDSEVHVFDIVPHAPASFVALISPTLPAPLLSTVFLPRMDILILVTDVTMKSLSFQ